MSNANKFKKLRVIELCSGLGGTRLGLEQTGVFEVVQSSEIDQEVIQTYFNNFGELPLGDFSKVPIQEWKDCEVITASLPCQSYSTEGNHQGLEDDRGKLFYGLMKIVKVRKPDVVFIENVPGMIRLKNGEYFEEIKNALQKEGYFCHHKILKACDFGVPQLRERLFICAFKEKLSFQFPKPQLYIPKVLDILESEIDGKYFLTQEQIDVFIDKKTDYEERGHGFGYKVLNLEKPSRAILKSSSSLIKNLVPVKQMKNNLFGLIELTDTKGKKANFHLRYLTPRECARLQGFPEWYKFSSSNGQVCAQLGNAVPVPVIREIFKEIFLALMSRGRTLSPVRHESPADNCPIEQSLIHKYDRQIRNESNPEKRLQLVNEFKLKISIIKNAKSVA